MTTSTHRCPRLAPVIFGLPGDPPDLRFNCLRFGILCNSVEPVAETCQDDILTLDGRLVPAFDRFTLTVTGDGHATLRENQRLTVHESAVSH